jgi:hypothetical protein
MPENNLLLKKGDTINTLVTTKRLGRLESKLRKIAKG